MIPRYLIIDDLIAHGIVPVLASSDAVFDGTRGLWTEDDPVHPVLTCGRQKVEMETYVRQRPYPWLVVRLAKVVGTAPGLGDMLGDWMNQLEAGAAIRCAHDQAFSPVDVDDVASALIRLVQENCTGIFHVCGPRAMSRLEVLRLLAAEARRYRAVSAQIVPCSIRDFDFAEPRPLDTSLSPRKLYAVIGHGCADMSAVCQRAAARRYGS